MMNLSQNEITFNIYFNQIILNPKKKKHKNYKIEITYDYQGDFFLLRDFF